MYERGHLQHYDCAVPWEAGYVLRDTSPGVREYRVLKMQHSVSLGVLGPVIHESRINLMRLEKYEFAIV